MSSSKEERKKERRKHHWLCALQHACKNGGIKGFCRTARDL